MSLDRKITGAVRARRRLNRVARRRRRIKRGTRKNRPDTARRVEFGELQLHRLGQILKKPPRRD